MIRFAAILSALVLLAGCASDPLQGVPRLADTDVSEGDIQAALRSDPETPAADRPAPRGLFAGLLGQRTSVPAPVPDVVIDVPDAEETTQVPDAPTPPQAEPATRGGLLGFLRRAAADAQQTDPTTEVASLAPRADSATPSSLRSDAPDARVVPLGTNLPYGSLARVCDVRSRQLGKRIERYPEGRGMYAIYDSDPGNTAPHTFYVTGFKDGCARQFTAALALFGSTTTHEQLRYGLPAQVQPYSKTDAAYEQLKTRVCRVRRGQPCGSALPRLARNTVFVSVYGTFGSNSEWKTILIHDGEVIETDIRGG